LRKPPHNFLKAKNMQKLARFRSTSKFGGEYLRKKWRYSKSVSHSFDSDFFRVWFGKVRSSDFKDLDMELYPPKTHFSEEHISASRGCCAPKFLHALKCNKWALITSELKDVARRNFGTWRVFTLGCQRKYKFWGLCSKFLVFSPHGNDSFRENLCFSRNVFLVRPETIDVFFYFLVRPEAITCGADLCIAAVFFFLFFSSRNLRAPSADRREILHDAWCCVQFYNPGLEFWGSLPTKFLEVKNLQNLARFRSYSKFGGEYLQNG